MISFLGVSENVSSFFASPMHIVGIVLVVCSLLILAFRKFYLSKFSEKYTAKKDIAFKVSALIVMLVACLLSIL